MYHETYLPRAATMAFFGVLFLIGCSVVSAAPVPDVVVSSRPLHSLVAGIMRGVASPRLLIDGEQAPWDYTPDQADAAALVNADILVWGGAELEPGLAVLTGFLGMQTLGDDATQLQPIFITIDPARDTPEVLGEYVAYFDERMLGLSANPEITKRTAELFKARYEKVVADDGDQRRYTMDHTASLYLLGRDGEFITKFAHGLPAREVAAQIRRYMRE